MTCCILAMFLSGMTSTSNNKIQLHAVQLMPGFLHELAFLLMTVSACAIVPLKRICKCCRAVVGWMCQPSMAHGQAVWTEWWVTSEQWFRKLLLVASLLSLGMTGECFSAWSRGLALTSPGPRWVGLVVWDHLYLLCQGLQSASFS